jgi:Zinc finger, C2H2 type
MTPSVDSTYLICIILKVYEDDGLPKLLCTTCVGLLETIENFKEACTRSVDSIRKLIIANLKEEPMMEIVSAEALEPILKVEIEQYENIHDNREEKVQAHAKSSKGRPVCDLCGKTFVNMRGIRQHMKLKLEKRLMVPKGNSNVRKGKTLGRKIFCTQDGCHQNFNNRKNLENHMKMHEDSKVSCFKGITEHVLNRSNPPVAYLLLRLRPNLLGHRPLSPSHGSVSQSHRNTKSCVSHVSRKFQNSVQIEISHFKKAHRRNKDL